MSLENIILILKNLTILAGVVVAINLVLRYVNKYISKDNSMIKIVERLSTSKDSSICIAMICDEYYLLSINKDSHNILKDLDKDEVEEILKEKRENSAEEFKLDFSPLKNIKEKTKAYLEMGKKIE